jgi:hypothetical protein
MWTKAKSLNDMPGGLPPEAYDDPDGGYDDIFAFVAIERHGYVQLRISQNIKLFFDGRDDSYFPCDVAFTKYIYHGSRWNAISAALKKYQVKNQIRHFNLSLNEFIRRCPVFEPDTAYAEPENVMPEPVHRKRGRPRKMV